MLRILLRSRRDVTHTQESSLSVRPRIPHLFSCVLGLALVALSWAPLRQLSALSLNDQRYSHIIMVPVISLLVMFFERRKVLARAAFDARAGLPLLLGSLALYWLVTRQLVPFAEDCAFPVAVFAILLVWASGFALCCGMECVAAARFPLLFLLLIVPIPFDAMGKIISLLQQGSIEVTYALFKLAGTPVFREGVRFELPGIGIEVAAECSSIHSSWALFITGLLLAHRFLDSTWTKVCLSVLTVPIAMFANAVRIVTLWFLGTQVDVGFLYGNLHHRGGILFSSISVSILAGFLYTFHRMEHHVPRAGLATAPLCRSRMGRQC